MIIYYCLKELLEELIMGIKGFTLAETLITLGIIGVVAALTIPALITNHQKEVTLNKLKETYSLLGQAFKSATVENGGDMSYLFTNSSDTDNQKFAEKFIAKNIIPYVNVIEDCGYQLTKCRGKSYTYLDNTTTGYLGVVRYGVLLKNGTFLDFVFNYGHSDATIYVDLNDKKENNKFGQDIFVMYIEQGKNGIFFDGYKLNDTQLEDNCKKGGNGRYCGALIQRNNWQFPKDYPW